MVAAGGKRLRPAFCHWAFVGAGGDRDDASGHRRRSGVRADARLRPVPRRRDGRCRHPTWARRRRTRSTPPSTRASGWAGESRRFGEGVAILVGDLAFVLADQLLVGAPDAVWRMWNELRIELNVGQFLDILGTVRGERRLADGRADRPLQERQVQRRATAARRRPAGRAGARRRAAPALSRLRAAARRRLPDARRRHRRVRRCHGVGQAGRRRPPRGQADATARPRRRRGRRRAARRSRSRGRPPISTPTRSAAFNRSSSTPARSATWSARWPTLPTSPSAP